MSDHKFRCPKCGKIFYFSDMPYLWCPNCYGEPNVENTDISLVPVKEKDGRND